MLHQLGVAMIREAGRKLLEDAGSLLHFSQHQTTAITGDRATVKVSAYFSSI
jgi:hypothetical protein